MSVMRPVGGKWVFVLVALLLSVELIGAGASLTSGAQAKPVDACFGYALCQ